MTGSEICSCLSLLGHTGFISIANTDEATAADIIINSWTQCPYSSAQEMLIDCSKVLPQVKKEANKALRAAELADISWRLNQAAGYRAIGEDDSIALDKYRAARAEIDAKYPQS